MLNDPSKEEPNPELEIEASEKPPVSSQEVIEIDTKTGKPAEKIQQTSTLDSSEIERKLSAQFNYQLRQIQKQNKELADQLASLKQVQPARRAETDGLDDFDTENERVAQTDWRKAVDQRAERIASKLAEEKIRAFQDQQKQEHEKKSVQDEFIRLETRSKEKVLKEFPDLLDENSDTFKTYIGIYNREIAEDPYFLNNPRKFEIVAAELKGRGVMTQNPEVERLKRVAAGSSSSSRSVQQGNRVQLTQEEIEFCDRSGIPYASFAQNRNAMKNGSFKEGLELKQ